MLKLMKRVGLLLAVVCPGLLRASAPPPPSGLHVVGTLAITSEPQNQMVIAGQSATFSVTVVGDPPLNYQWAVNGVNVGSNTNVYTHPSCQLADNEDNVQVVVSNSEGSVASSTVSLTVAPVGSTYYYASPLGSSSNTGLSTNSPWPLQYALANAGIGNTVVVMDGVYSSTNGFALTSGSCRHLVAQNKWKPVLTGSTAYAQLTVWGAAGCVMDGLCISNATGCGIASDSMSNTVRNCWILQNGTHGIDFSAAGCSNNLVEYNLVEHNNTVNLATKHGIYFGGLNNTIRGNVFRYNGAGFGIHLYSEYAISNNNNQIYNNLTEGHTNRFGVVVWANATNDTNFVFGNTILDGLQVVKGIVCITNNIILPSSHDPNNPIDSISGVWPQVNSDYNLGTNSFIWTGPHDSFTNYSGIGFVNPANGLYWISSTSAVRGRALSTGCGPVDFFGNPQSSVTDIGAFQYNAVLSGDMRVLEPSPAEPDYWSKP